MNRLIASDLHKERNACVLNSVWTLRSDLCQKKILEVFQANGYDPAKGCYPETIFNSLTALGVGHEIIGIPVGGCTASAIAKHFKEGCYLVWTKFHAFAIIGGRIIDPYFGRPMARGKVVVMLKITDAAPYIAEQGVAKKTGTVRAIVNKNPKRKGTASWLRFEYLLTELQHGRNNLEFIKAASGYTDADLRWDVQHGYLVVE